MKPVKDHTGYFVDEDGKVFSDRVKGHMKTGSLHELKPRYNNKGYAIITARNDITGRRDDLLVHRLVAEAYIPNPLDLPEVNHKYGNKRDNRVSELEWTTSAGNTKHAIETGLCNPIGIHNNNAKLDWDQVREIRETYTPWDREYGGQALAKKYNISDSELDAIVRGIAWKDDDYRYSPIKRKLTDIQVSEIIESYIPKDPNFCEVALGKKYGVSTKTISNVVRGKYGKGG